MKDHGVNSSRPRAMSLATGLWLSAAALLGLTLISFIIGKYEISLHEVFTVLVARLRGTTHDLPATLDTVVLQIRMPRLIAAIVIGAGLAAAGSTYQSLFRNPLASPDILGVSAGAGLGAALAIFLSLPVFMIQLSAFAAGSVTVTLVYLISRSVRGHDPVLVLVLAGVVVGTLAGSCLSLIKYLADPYEQLPAITFWLLGSLNSVSPGDLIVTFVFILTGLVPLVLLRWRMNLMSLGDEEARALGVNVARLRIVFIAAATLITASAVAISGVIGWVGLMIPHVARLMVGPDFRRLLPTAMLLGAAFLLAVDDLARTIAQIEVPLGILTSFLGAPFFLWLLARSRRGWQ